MTKHVYTIGSNNETGQMEAEKAIGIVSRYTDGLTAYPVQGYWQGKAEQSLRIEVIQGNGVTYDAETVAAILRDELEQQAVMLETVDAAVSFV
jgi:hypothetical protein